jgi:ribokinase
MVTKVGDDTYGKDTIDNYKANNIDTKHVLTTSEVSSGLAPITVDKVLT